MSIGTLLPMHTSHHPGHWLWALCQVLWQQWPLQHLRLALTGTVTVVRDSEELGGKESETFPGLENSKYGLGMLWRGLC